MAYYGVIFPEFWTGATGRELRAAGKDAQLLSLYLATNRHANMIGLYRLRLEDVRHEIGLGLKGLVRAFTATARTQYALYDAASAYVWVRTMARFRLGMKAGEPLAPDDNKVSAVNRLYQAIDPNPFLGTFFDENHKLLRLRRRRDDVGLVVAVSAGHHRSGLQAPTKPLVSQVTESGSEEQVQKQESAGAPRQPILVALTHETLKTGSFESIADVAEAVKTAAAKYRIPYDSDTVARALRAVGARGGRYGGR